MLGTTTDIVVQAHLILYKAELTIIKTLEMFRLGREGYKRCPTVTLIFLASVLDILTNVKSHHYYETQVN